MGNAPGNTQSILDEDEGNENDKLIGDLIWPHNIILLEEIKKLFSGTNIEGTPLIKQVIKDLYKCAMMVENSDLIVPYLGFNWVNEKHKSERCTSQLPFKILQTLKVTSLIWISENEIRKVLTNDYIYQLRDQALQIENTKEKVDRALNEFDIWWKKVFISSDLNKENIHFILDALKWINWQLIKIIIENVDIKSNMLARNPWDWKDLAKLFEDYLVNRNKQDLKHALYRWKDRLWILKNDDYKEWKEKLKEIKV